MSTNNTEGAIPKEFMEWVERQTNGFSFECKINWEGGAQAAYRKLTETKATVVGMQTANAAQVLAGYLWNHMPNVKDIVEGSIGGGFSINQQGLLSVLMKFQQWVYENQPKDTPVNID